MNINVYFVTLVEVVEVYLVCHHLEMADEVVYLDLGMMVVVFLEMRRYFGICKEVDGDKFG